MPLGLWPAKSIKYINNYVFGGEVYDFQTQVLSIAALILDTQMQALPHIFLAFGAKK
jgi:hypothetical protein